MELRKRLLKLKTENGLTTDALSERSGVPKGTINKLLNGETRNPTTQTLRRLAEALNVPLETLCGKPADIPGVYRLGDLTSGLRNAASIQPVTTRRVPLLGEIAAGQPILCDRTADLVDCGCDAACDFALRVSGDSMIGARIRDGDIVFIRSQPDVDDGQIAAVIIDDHATLKRVYHLPGALHLISENPAYPPILAALPSGVRILGLAVAFTSPLL